MEIRMKTLMAGRMSRATPARPRRIAEEGEMLVKGGYAEAVIRPAAEAKKPAAKGKPKTESNKE